MLLSIATWSNNADFGMRIIDLQIRSYRDSVTVFITRMIAGLGNVFFYIYTSRKMCLKDRKQYQVRNSWRPIKQNCVLPTDEEYQSWLKFFIRVCVVYNHSCSYSQ